MDTLRVLWVRPITQACIVGMVLFCLPGMFDALSALGAGGLAATSVSLTDEANAALYACFAVVGFMGGSIVNTLGPRWTLFLGTLGYTLYVGSLWSIDENGNRGFVITGGVLCGISAGLLWSVHGMVTMSYADEKHKARYFAITWSLLSIGATLGGLIPLVQNLHATDTSGVNNGTYAGFIAVMLVGSAISLLMVDPKAVRRKDGTRLEDFRQTDFKHEVIGVFRLIKDWRIMLLLPAFLASNWFYSYQFGMNAFYFSLRTRSLNSLIYWLTQVIGTTGLSVILDNSHIRRRKRGLIGLTIVCVFVMTTWAGGAAFQTTFTRDSAAPAVDWTSSNFGGPFALYFFYGLADSMWQSWCYWIMGALTNESYTLARYAGFYKGVQSAGSAISFGIDAVHAPFMSELIINFVLLGASIPLMYFVACQVKESNYGLEEEVIPPLKEQGKLVHDDSANFHNVEASKEVAAGQKEITKDSSA